VRRPLSLGDHFPLCENNRVPSYSVCSDPRRTAMAIDRIYYMGVGGDRTEWVASQFGVGWGGGSVVQWMVS
jgi:hypothetical protein